MRDGALSRRGRSCRGRDGAEDHGRPRFRPAGHRVQVTIRGFQRGLVGGSDQGAKSGRFETPGPMSESAVSARECRFPGHCSAHEHQAAAVCVCFTLMVGWLWVAVAAAARIVLAVAPLAIIVHAQSVMAASGTEAAVPRRMSMKLASPSPECQGSSWGESPVPSTLDYFFTGQSPTLVLVDTGTCGFSLGVFDETNEVGWF